MRALIDTDILLDVALAREPYLEASRSVFRWAVMDRTAAVAWHSLPNCAYVLPMSDVEDAFQAAAALAWRADYIVTRNVRDYVRSPVPALTPADFLRQLE